MNKGIDTIVEETKVEVAKIVNTKLKEGLPISVISLIMEGVLFEIKAILNKSLQMEAKQLEELQAQQNDIVTGKEEI